MIVYSALKRDVTRMGKRTKRGAFDDGVNSLRRYYINNYQDIDKQVGIDALLGYIDGTSVLGVKSVSTFKQSPTGTMEKTAKLPKVKKSRKKEDKVVQSAKAKSSTSERKKSAVDDSSSKKVKDGFANALKVNVDKFKKQITSQHLFSSLFTNGSNGNSTSSVNATASERYAELDDILFKLQRSVAEAFK